MSALVRPLDVLLRLYPRAFRERFGNEMSAELERGLHRARQRGGGAELGYVLASALDLLRSAAAERLDPSWPPPRAARYPNPKRSRRETKTMRAILDDLKSDLRLAARSLRRSPGFTAIAAGTLALAIGAAASLYSAVDAVLLRPLPFAAAERLVYIGATAPGSDLEGDFGVADEFYLQYKELSRLLESVSTYNSFTNTLRTPDRVERIRMSYPTTDVYATLGAKPLLGRLLTDEDKDTGVLISHALWSSWFGADPAILGRVLDVGGDQRAVVGVMPPEFVFPNETTLLWLPDVIRAEGLTPGRFGNRLVARLKPGVTTDELELELDALARRLPERFGGTANYARLMEKHKSLVQPLVDRFVGTAARPLWVLLAAAGVVLLAASANVANLFLVRAESRQRDLALRRAIGAGRGRLVRLQLAESLVVAALAGTLAIGVAALFLPALVAAAPEGIHRLGDAGLSWKLVAFAFAAALGSALVCGLGPALRASLSSFSRLREGGRGATHHRRIARAVLVAGQTALALLLLIGSGLLAKSHRELANVDPGYETADLFTFQIAPERPELND